MKKLLLVTASLVALGAAAPAMAADLAARPYTKAPPMVQAAYNWSGFYIGVNGGGGTSHKCWDIAGLSEGCHDATGGTVGGQVGYRWQTGPVVFGVEAQGNWADFTGDNISQVFAADRNRTKIDAFGLFTGQVGWAVNNALFYVKGGAAVTDSHYDIFSPAGAFLGGTGDQARWGGTVGAGIEYGFAPNWSVAAEYDHMFMQDKNLAFTAPGGAAFGFDNPRQDVDLVTVRLNYRWGGPVIAKY